ncbi:hypothetical protein NSZ01_11390 [Nocardioides szechwanensis]|uniref:Uncharacterized protein n=1 Tax=Nocardioides szechwanensis TaxID=1005944 RepID=A0A1H0CPG8_9ACTN|nr:hypothetical protein [Nocardioides szechwanensis]GEP33371.1 hypothetical protein NSZ01_11390 [Nocardioides szechwanensis]SDN59691.1 hypothetical protein SAMN05192576_2485 [Nocardioides szechwanensis]
MRHTPPLGVAVALGAAKTLILLVALAMAFGVIGGDTTSSTVTRPDRAPQMEAQSAQVEQAIRRHDCSVAGFDAGVEPRSALVRREGKVRHVSFDDGWEVFTGERPGELIAVCLDDY